MCRCLWPWPQPVAFCLNIFACYAGFASAATWHNQCCSSPYPITNSYADMHITDQTLMCIPALCSAPTSHPQRDVQFKHPGSSTGFTLNLRDFSVAPGELVAVVGRVGAGKSSLISAILGNMEKTRGAYSSGGRVAYVPQNPWCQNLSLRDSILFGSELDQAKYEAVIHACALELDLEILPEGDMSMAGLRGINLSGGQRQRLNLARAAYAESDLVLLDNALSAVDHHTVRIYIIQAARSTVAAAVHALLVHLHLHCLNTWPAAVAHALYGPVAP